MTLWPILPGYSFLAALISGITSLNTKSASPECPNVAMGHGSLDRQFITKFCQHSFTDHIISDSVCP